MTHLALPVAGENVFTLFARQADWRPDAAAVIDHAGTTTYRELLARAGAVASALSGRGLEAEQPVGVLMHRTTDLVATLLGILKAGGCYVPLDPDDPVERTNAIVRGAACRLVIGHDALLGTLRSKTAGTAASPTCIDVDTLTATTPLHEVTVSPGGHRLAYVLFTSGSTGAPKGVEVEHRSVVNLLLAACDLLGFTERDRYLATATIGFDISVAELFLPLITGGAVVLRSRQLLLDPHRLADEIRRQRVTVFQTGPPVWSIVLAEIADFPRLRVAITTGEAIAPDLARRLATVADTAWNLYGPTEATVWATGHRLTPLEEEHAGMIPSFLPSTVSAPIGRPLSNVEVRVLDEQRRPVPAGGKGELWIGGEALARGYRGNVQLTRERFVVAGEPDEDAGRRFYRTGDIVAADAGGTLHYFGRNDDQIKVRGVRIEPMEVERAILRHAGVAQAAATWFESAAGARSVVAAVVVRAGHHVTVEQLHEHVSRLLPSAMIPSRVVFCDALPLSPSGKVDRHAIRARAADASQPAAISPSSDALTDTERRLIAIWEETLGIRPVSRRDHFFTIGGDSLSAVTTVLEVEAAFDISLAARVLFEAPTLERLAERIDRLQVQKSAAMKEPVQAEALTNDAFVFPLAQQGHGHPVFFHNIDLRMARKGLWTLDMPLYTVVQWAQGSGFTGAKSVEDLARMHLDAIRPIQPRGPYRLAGYSFGGLVALEMAHQLRRSGEAVEMLFLLDPSEPFTDGYRMDYPKWDGSVGDEPALGRRATRRAQALIAASRGIGDYVRVPPQLARAALKVLERTIKRPAWEWISYHLVHFYGRHPNPVSARLLPKNRWPAFWYTTKRLSRAYDPQPYDGAVLAMFMAHQERQSMWRRLLGPTADVRIVDTHHHGMFIEPALSMWLQPLRERLADAPRVP